MKRLLIVSAVVEAVTGLGLLVYPPIVTQLLFGAEIAGQGTVVSRIAGIALIALGVACWPGSSVSHALYAMLTYNALVMSYLAYVAFVGGLTGQLLWPAIVVHMVLTLLLARACFNLGAPFRTKRSEFE